MKLYGYFRSSAAFRVRIALNLKGLAYDTVPIHLRRNDQAKPDYREVNPQGLVPTLEDGGETLIQSLAIIEYLDETYPDPRLLPAAPAIGRECARSPKSSPATSIRSTICGCCAT
jgi:maleylpyruvate isomerase